MSGSNSTIKFKFLIFLLMNGRLHSRRQRRSSPPQNPSQPPPGGGGTFGGMKTRVSRLEDDMTELKADMKTALKDLAYLKGKVDTLPATL